MFQLQHKNSTKGPLWLVEKKYVMGSGSGCDIKVSGAGVKAMHAEIRVSGDAISVINIAGDALTVDGQVVKAQAELRPGSVLSLGDEQFELVDPKAKVAKAAVTSQSVSGWALKALNTALADKNFPLNGAQVIGRSKECDVSLGVVHLSRKHAKITVTDRGLVVEDLNSSNGTYLNGKKVTRATATAGDEISFDTMRFRVIGPVIDDDKTTLRPSSDGDLTTVRPALNIPPSPDAPKAAKTQGKQRQRSTAQASQAKTVPSDRKPMTVEPQDEGSSKGMGIVIVGVVAIVAVAAVWYFLKV